MKQTELHGSARTAEVIRDRASGRRDRDRLARLETEPFAWRGPVAECFRIDSQPVAR